MSVLDLAEAAASATTPWGQARLALKAFGKALPYLVILGLVIALVITRGTLDHVRMEAKLEAKDAQLASAKHDAEQAGRTTTAVQAFATEMLNRAPVVLHATDTVREYAQTPAGRASCAAPDIVRRTDALDAALFPEGPTNSGNAAVPPDAAPPPVGWLGRLLGRRADDRGRPK